MTPDLALALQAAAAAWAQAEPGVRAVALLGSWARGAARPDSDLDLLMLTHDLEKRLSNDAWLRRIVSRAGRTVVWTSHEPYGGAGVASWRAWTDEADEVEVLLAAPSWADVAPMDRRARRAAEDGLVVLVDKDGALARLKAALMGKIEFRRVSRPDDWRAFHQIRRTVLFEGRGRVGIYDSDHPDDRTEANHPLLLLEDGHARGVARLDLLGEGRAGVRLVAIEPYSQRRGLGRVLMQQVERYAAEREVALLEVNSTPDAVPFYQRIGWTLANPDLPNPLLTRRL